MNRRGYLLSFVAYLCLMQKYMNRSMIDPLLLFDNESESAYALISTFDSMAATAYLLQACNLY
jgi:hypothetical protein